MEQTKIQHITLLSENYDARSAPILIVGNAYGIMPYIRPLADKLCSEGYTPYWFAFSGQNGTPGEYSFEQGIIDLKLVTAQIRERHPERDIKAISHCAGSLMVIQYLERMSSHPFSRMIIYGLLYNANRRRQTAERKLKECGVKFKLSDEDWSYNPLLALSKIRIPTSFFHAKDKLNIERATPEEMDLAVRATQRSRLLWIEEGYDTNTEKIDNFFDHYLDFLKGEDDEHN